MTCRKSYTPTRFSARALLSLCALAAPVVAQDPPVYVTDEFIVVLTPQAAGTINVAGGPTVSIPSLQNVIAAQGKSGTVSYFGSAAQFRFA